jgi:hypothetical protein
MGSSRSFHFNEGTMRLPFDLIQRLTIVFFLKVTGGEDPHLNFIDHNPPLRRWMFDYCLLKKLYNYYLFYCSLFYYRIYSLLHKSSLRLV